LLGSSGSGEPNGHGSRGGCSRNIGERRLSRVRLQRSGGGSVGFEQLCAWIGGTRQLPERACAWGFRLFDCAGSFGPGLAWHFGYSILYADGGEYRAEE